MVNVVIIFTCLVGIILIFQLALVFGAPLGAYTLGGKAGKLSRGKRIYLLLEVVLTILALLIVYVQSQLIIQTYYNFANWAIWFVVAFYLFISLTHMINRNQWQRCIWAPVYIVLLTASVFIAFS